MVIFALCWPREFVALQWYPVNSSSRTWTKHKRYQYWGLWNHMSEIITEKNINACLKKRPGVWSGCVDSPPPLCTSWTIFRHHQLIIITLVVDVIVIIVIILSWASPVVTFHEKRSSVPSHFSLRTCVHLRSIYIKPGIIYSASVMNIQYQHNIKWAISTWNTRHQIYPAWSWPDRQG